MSYKVYKIENLTNGKVYIGCTNSNGRYRFNSHKILHPEISKDYAESCEDNFLIQDVFETNDVETASQKELELIKLYRRRAYNGKKSVPYSYPNSEPMHELIAVSAPVKSALKMEAVLQDFKSRGDLIAHLLNYWYETEGLRVEAVKKGQSVDEFINSLL